MEISKLLSDDAILAEIGERIARRRLDLELTQAAVAEQAGIAKRTLERVEAGHSAQLASLIRILRVLDSLSGLDRMLPEAVPGPMDLLKGKGKLRQRARGRRAANPPDKPWSWGDES
jgi:transcriptional regulator with XRE-family HTH domain